MGKYLTENERYMIEAWRIQKMPVREIAARLGKHYTTIYKEIKKGTVQLLDGKTWKTYEKYCADVAQRKTDEKGHNKGRDLKIGHDHELANYIEHMIVDRRYSPYAVVQSARKSGRFKTDICETTLYSYIDKGIFCNVTNKNLPIKSKKKQEYKGVAIKRPSYRKPPCKSIENRPKEIDERLMYGHWEMDTVYSGKGKSKACLLVLTERKTLDEYVIKMPDRTLVSTVKALDDLEQTMGIEAFRKKFLTITCDNGVEFGNADQIERSVVDDRVKRTEVYFCHPYSSYERGSNEGQNKLVRRWIPKGEDIGKCSDAEIQDIENWINDYPRRKFGGMSTREYKTTLTL